MEEIMTHVMSRLSLWYANTQFTYFWVAGFERKADVVEGEVVGLEWEEHGRPVGQGHREVLRATSLLVARRSQNSLLILGLLMINLIKYKSEQSKNFVSISHK